MEGVGDRRGGGGGRGGGVGVEEAHHGAQVGLHGVAGVGEEGVELVAGRDDQEGRRHQVTRHLPVLLPGQVTCDRVDRWTGGR